MSDTLGTLFVKLDGDTKDLDKKIDQSKKGVDKFSKNLKSFGTNMTKFATLPILAAGAGLVKLTSNIGKNADKLLDLEQITGLSTDTLQEFQNVATVAGVSFEGLTGIVQKFTSRLPTIEAGTSESAKAFNRLGVSLKDTNGNVRDANDLVPELITALQDIENVTDRNATAQQVFGRSLGDLAPVLGMTAEQTKEAREQAHELGLVWEKEAILKANEFRVQSEQLTAQFKQQGVELGSSLIPVFQELMPVLSDLVSNITSGVQTFSDFDDGTKRLVIGIAAVTAGIGPAIKGVQALGLAFKTLGAVGGPVAIVGLAITGIIAGIKLLKELRLSKLEEEFGGLSDKAGLSAEAISDATEAAALSIRMGTSLDDALKTTQNNYDINRETLLEALTIGGRLDDSNLNRALRELDGLKRTQIELDKKKVKLEEEEEANQRLRDAEEKRAAEVEALRVLELAQLKQINDQIKANIQAVIDSAKTETQLIDEQILEIQSLSDAEGQLTADQLEAIEILRAKKAEINNEERIATKTKIQERIEAEQEASDKAIELAQKEKEEKIQQYSEYANFISSGMNSIATLAQNLDKAESQRLDASLKASIDALEEEGLTEEEFNTKKQALEKETAEKKYDLELKAFNTNKAIAVVEAGIATALGIAKSLPNLVLAGIVGGLGAAQVAAIISQPEPPKPAFAKGGVATKETNAIVGEAGGEVMFGMGAEGNPMFERFIARTVAGLQSGNKGGDVYNFHTVFGMQSPSELRKMARTVTPYINEYNEDRL
ncbi:MAG: phage tail tape measure protein [Colwellia sp.]|nr:phage tail tape measure protein [Colwellia sp.]